MSAPDCDAMTELTRAIADAINAHRRWESWGEIDGAWYCGGCEKRIPGDLFDTHVAAVVEAHLRPVVTTVAELDALPVGTIAIDSFGAGCTKVADRDNSYGGVFAWVRATSAVKDGRHFHKPWLPATVLHLPEATP